MTRREQREHIFKLLFFVEFYEKEELGTQVQAYFGESWDDEEPEKKDVTYVCEKFDRICEKLPQIDALLAGASEGWKMNRIGKVELALLRLATYEIRFDEKIPDGVAINEAVELAKKFGSTQASAFVNGILAKLV